MGGVGWGEWEWEGGVFVWAVVGCARWLGIAAEGKRVKKAMHRFGLGLP